MAAASRRMPTTAAGQYLSSRCLLSDQRRIMSDKTVIHVIDDDAAMRDSLAFLLDVNGFEPQVYESADAFLKGTSVEVVRCVISAIRRPGMTGVELVRKLKGGGSARAVILITGHGDV